MSKQRPIILIGGGGHCMSVIEAAESAGAAILGILDAPEMVGRHLLGHPFIGSDADITLHAAHANFIVCVGSISNADTRYKLYHQVLAAGGQLGCIVASTARVSRHAHIGPGTVVLHHALVNAGAQVGENCIINSHANVEHGCTIGSHVHLSTAATINGDCHIGEKSFIGSRSIVYQGCSIPGNCVIAAGSVVRDSLSKAGVYAGNPATLKKTR